MRRTRYPYQSFSEIRSEIYERDNWTCQKCGKTVGDLTEINRPVGHRQQIILSKDDFVVHHKDFDKFNNLPDNLKVLCDSCHHSLHKRNPKLPTLQNWLG